MNASPIITFSTGAFLPETSASRRPAPASTPPTPHAGAGLSLSVRSVCRSASSCRANQCRDASARQQLLKNDCSSIVSAWRLPTASEQLFGRCGRISRRSIWRSGSAAANARHSSTSPASASLRRAPSSSSWTRSIDQRSAARRRGLTARQKTGAMVWPPRPPNFSSDARSRRFPRGHDPVICRTGVRSSSGGGLGIHEPGSNTRGFASRRQSPSGRARDRAICPAVARSIARRAA